jgi:hypothetical protein
VNRLFSPLAAPLLLSALAVCCGGWSCSAAAASAATATAVATTSNTSLAADYKKPRRTSNVLVNDHGPSSCATAQVDTAGGPSRLTGLTADGFPIYRGSDMSGNVITPAQLNGCNGITSATPEFPSGAYDYALPEGATSFQSSPRCYTGAEPARSIEAFRTAGEWSVAVATIAPLLVLASLGLRGRR